MKDIDSLVSIFVPYYNDRIFSYGIKDFRADYSTVPSNSLKKRIYKKNPKS